MADAPAATDAPDATVDRILDGALAEFVDIGIRRATIGSVARRAGVAPATIYRRVGQRDELVGAVVGREVQRTLATVTTRLEPFSAPEDRMVEGFVAALRLVVDHPLIRRLLDLEPESLAVPFTTGAAPILELGRAYVAADLRSAVRGDAALDADALAELLVRFAHSLVLTPSEPLADDERARAFARAVLVPLVVR
ncbi:helix-turn-helix domain-containing protein [Patulibacter sp. NPDC049589]|uniref:TetR/AcrR family transcriptional regulator n=1 Tax=Patulibacter sp. NPDC049589 TaxID=3154731 RepID=UPI0034156D26